MHFARTLLDATQKLLSVLSDEGGNVTAMTNNDPSGNWGTGGESGPGRRGDAPPPNSPGSTDPREPSVDPTPSRFGATGPYGSPGRSAAGSAQPGSTPHGSGPHGSTHGSAQRPVQGSLQGPGRGGGTVGTHNGGHVSGPAVVSGPPHAAGARAGHQAGPQSPQQPAPQGPGGNGSRTGRGIGALGITALMLGSAAVGGATGALVIGNRDSAPATADNTGVTNALEEPGVPREDVAPEGSIEAAAQIALPSVVSIQVQTETGVESGSGSILSSDGLVLTNQHVVASGEKPGSRIQVLLNDGTTHPAEYVAGHGPSDIAVIQVQGVNDLRPISLGDSDMVAVGQEVVAVGSPLGLTSTVTSGIVSALNRPVSVSGERGEASVIDAIQTDAAINPGNSGGALVDLDGNLVAVPSVIASNSGAGQQAGSIGLGFAIPINQARRIAEELISEGGVSMPAVNAQIDTRSRLPGALVGAVTPGGAADRAGLREGDLIVKIDDRRVDSGVALIAAIRSRAVGETVTLTVTDTDGTGERTVDVTLEAARE